MPVKIIATGSKLPKLSVDNTELEKMVDTTDEWIYTRTGIKSRRIITDEHLDDLAFEAAEAAIDQAKIDRNEIGLIICATFTADSGVPSLSCLIRKRLGIENAIAFDVNAACTGFIYALTVAESLMKTAGYKKALIIGAEALSEVIDWSDRGTCILFGDGAGAAILSQSDTEGILAAQIGGQIDADNALYLDGIQTENPFSKCTKHRSTIKMNGKAVFSFAVNELSKLIKDTAEKANIPVSDIDYFIPHQANVRIIKSTAQRMGIDPDKFFMNIENVGNTSAASIAIALDELNRSGKLKSGETVMLVGFGGGFTSGAVLFRI